MSVIHECPDCGLFNRLGEPVPGTDMVCGRCKKTLRRVRHNSLRNALSCTAAACIFFTLTIAAPFLHVLLFGRFRSSTLETGPVTLDDQGLWLLAAVVLLTTVFIPFVKIAGTLYVLLGLKCKKPPSRLVTVFTWLRHIGPWAMIDVYLLGFIVAFTRLQAIMRVDMGLGAYALVGLMITMIASDAALDPEAVWEKMQKRGLVILRRKQTTRQNDHLIGCETCHQVSLATDGDDCPRCNEIVYSRKPGGLERAWAFVIAAAILYIPSNMYPIMNVTRFGKVQNYTIFGGMQELIGIGLWPLALLVFTASMVIPVFKLIALAYTLIQTHRGLSDDLMRRTQLYRIIDFIGRWSMVDVFMVSILVALVRFGQFAQITADVGAVYFASVVILTIVAVESFDPRLMWDRARSTASHLSRSDTPKAVSL